MSLDNSNYSVNSDLLGDLIENFDPSKLDPSLFDGDLKF